MSISQPPDAHNTLPHVLATRWWRHLETSFAGIPQPVDAPRAHAPGPDPDRILIFGTGSAAGWGVLTHDLTLPGHLARASSRLTRHGTDADLHARGNMVLADALEFLGDYPLWRYDAVVVSIGTTDALQQTPEDQWSRDLRRFLDVVHSRVSRGTPLLLLGIPPLSSVPLFRGIFGELGDRHGRSLNAVMRETSVRREDVHFVPLASQEQTFRHRTSDDYRAWAGQIAVRLAETLPRDGVDRSGPPGDTARRRRSQPQDEPARLEALRALRLLDSAPDPRLDRLTETARAAFGTRFAAVTLIDHDRQWNLSSAGFDPAVVARTDSLCAVTVETPEPLVIPDLASYEGFTGDKEIRFYAGVPIEDPTGYRIGALCVFDSTPRAAGEDDTALLRILAHAVESEIWNASRRDEASLARSDESVHNQGVSAKTSPRASDTVSDLGEKAADA